MFIPDVINTLLMGLIFMVIVVTVVRPFVLHIVNGAMTTEDLQKEAIEAVQQEMMRVSMVAEAQRNDQILFQQLLLEVPEKPKHKPVPEIALEAEETKVQEEEVQPVAPEETAAVEGATDVPEVVIEAEETKVQEEVQPDATEETAAVEGATDVGADGALTENVAETQEGDAEDPAAASGEIVMQEGESLADVKARMKREQAKAKNPTIPP